jgi:hypothetical protein
MNRSTFVVAQVAFLFAGRTLLAQPVVSGANPASFTNGRTGVVISGSSFGTKSPAAPLKWDNFESGTVGQKVVPNNGWTREDAFDKVDVTYTNVNQRAGSTRSTYHDLTHSNPSFGMDPGAGTWGELYVSYYNRHHITTMGTSSGPKNIKEFKIFGNLHDILHPSFGLEIAEVDPGPSSYFGGRFGQSDSLQGMAWGLASFPNDQWIRREFWLRTGDSPGQRFKYWQDSQLYEYFQSPGNFPGGMGATWGDDGGLFRQIWFLEFIRGGSAGYSQFDDVYIDTTQARVEIGNAATFNSCTHREIQIPTAWSGTSITVTANQGSFENGKTAYLYVIDADGNVNAQGYPIMFGEAPIGDGTPPFVSGQSPAPDAQNVPVNSSVVLHVQDSGDGVDVASIAVKVNGASVTPQITGTSSNYTVTYTPASPFAYNSTVTVAVNARDLHTPANVMSEVAYSFKTTAGDTAPPFVSGQSPAPNAQNIPVNASVVLHVQDSGDGVERASIAMTVNGAAVTPQITGTSLDYTVTYAPASPFAYNATVTVTVNARDLHTPPNVMTQVSYSFKTTAGDTAPPFVSGQSPAPNAQNIPVNASVVLHVQDSGDGVERASIALTVNGVAVTPQITGTSSDYTVTYAPASPFAYNATVTVTVNARDLHSPPNMMSQVSYSFKTTAGDTAAPVVTGQSPAPNAQNVPVNTSVVLHVQDSGDGVERASIAMTVNGAAVTPVIEGTPADYTVRYDPASDFAYNSTVTVTVNARDLHTPSNVMNQVSYSFKTELGDIAAPVVTGQSPGPDEQNVLVDSNVVLHVQDFGDGVDIASIQVKVNGVTVTPQITGAPSDYTVTYDPPSPFGYDSVVTVTVNVRDLHSPPNVMAEVAYSFKTQPEGAVTEEWGEGSVSDHPGTVEDTYINIDAANYAAENTTVNTYTWPANSAANAILMKFNLSAIPQNATVTSAKLYLYMYDASTDATYDVNAHKVINVNPVISAATGYTYDGVNTWTPHQGLYDNIPLAQSDIAPAENAVAVDRTFGYKEWTVTNMVAEWVANPATNRGLLLNPGSTAPADAYRFFRPSEYADAAQRPRLVIGYTVGTPPPLPGAPGKPIHID